MTTHLHWKRVANGEPTDVRLTFNAKANKRDTFSGILADTDSSAGSTRSVTLIM